MTRFTSFTLICFGLAMVVFLMGFSTGTSHSAQPFTPSIEENQETDTSPEEVSEIMTPVCKLFFDGQAHPLPWSNIFGVFSPDNRYLAVSNESGCRTVLFDLKTGKNLKRFQGELSQSKIVPVAFSSDSRQIAFIGANNITVWDIPTDKEVCRIPLSDDPSIYYVEATVYSLRFSEDGNKLFGVVDNTGKIWNLEAQGAEVKTFSHVLTNTSDVFHCYPDLSHAMISDANTGMHRLRNLATNKDTERITNFCILRDYNYKEYIPRMVFSDDQKLFALEIQNQDHRGSRLLVWDGVTGNDICTVPLSYKLTAFAFLAGSNTLVTVCDPAPENPYVVQGGTHVPCATPLRTPVAKAETKAIVEFWDINHLIWHTEKANLFPRKIKMCYLEEDNDIHYMVSSQDGKLLYMRSGKPVVQTGSWLSVANGYIFSLDPNNKPDLPTEIRLDGVIFDLRTGEERRD